MTEKTATSPRTKYSFRSARSTTSSQSEEDVIQMNVIYKDREYSVKIPDQADRMTICNEIKRQTGVKGAFYLYNGTKSYLHSSSLTLSNISKVCGGRLEIRGGDCKLSKCFILSIC